MGFWSNAWSNLKAGAKEVAHDLGKAAKYVGQKIEQAGDWIDNKINSLGKNKSKPEFKSSTSSDHYYSSNTSSNSTTINEEQVKESIVRENDDIERFQKNAKKEAASREREVKKFYLSIYNKYISDFAEVFDQDIIKEIDKFIKNKSNSFKHVIRDEVNTKINSSYQPWKDFISKHPNEMQIQEFCDKVYNEADNNLLDLLQEVIEETNKYISKCITKYNEDRAYALSVLKESLINLSSNEETKAQELKRIAEQLVVAQFIAHEASKVI